MSIEIDGKSLDIKAEKLEQLKAVFPEFFTEGKIDFARVRELLSDDLAEADHYELSWAGKSEARKEIQKQTTAALIPDREGSINFDTSENIFIEGENLEVMRVLQKSYFGKIKMIYIDPPYNTGNDSFIYPDDYAERREDYEKRIGTRNGGGYLNKLDLFKKNTKENGQYHSVWLSMLYPRLYLARNLLREDGVIFVSIDNNELADLRLLMNEIFGEENFIGIICWKNVTDNNPTLINNDNEFMLCYGKQKSMLPQAWKSSYSEAKELMQAEYKRLKAETKYPEKIQEGIRQFIGDNAELVGFLSRYKHVDEQGVYTGSESVHNPRPGGYDFEVLHPDTKKPMRKPANGYRFPEDTFRKMEASGEILYGEDENRIVKIKKYLDDYEDTLRSVITLDGRLGSYDLKRVFETSSSLFSNPKPVDLLSTLISFVTDKDKGDIIADFFAGSGTSAHSVLELNKKDGGNRKFICVQMPEPLEEGSEPQRAGYKTIADVCKARIIKVIEHIASGNDSKMEFAQSKQDLGFKAYRLSYSNFKKWQAEITNKDDLLNQLAMFKEPLANKPPDSYVLLVELLVKAGLPLSAKVEKRTSEDGADYFVVETDRIVFALDKVSDALLAEVERIKPQTFVVLGNLFEGEKADELMTNWKLQLKEGEVEFKVI